MTVIDLNQDYLVRAITNDGSAQVFAATAKGLVEEARKMHDLSLTATAALGRTLIAGAMMGSAMKNEKDALSIVFNGDGPLGKIVVTAKSDGSVKGYVGNPKASLPSEAGKKLDVGGIVGEGTLQVIRDISMREPYGGTVEIQTGEIAEDLAYYFTVSDQIPSAVSLGVLLNDDGTVHEAGGFIVQMLPGADDAVAAQLEERIAAFPSISTLLAEGKNPEAIIEELFEGFEPKILTHTPICFRCDCTRERTGKLLGLMGKDELQEMIDEGENATLECAFCNKKYTFTVDEMKAIAAGL